MSKPIMTKISASQSKNHESSKPPAQAMEENEIVLKEEHKAIYDAFIQLLRNKAQSKELRKDDKAVLAFMLDQNQTIFTIADPEDIKPLSEENFLQLLLSVFEKIREENLANEENLKNDEIKKAVAKCVADVRVTEAQDSLIKLIGLPLGIKIDPKNISGSFISGLKEKIPFLGGDKKEEDEPPLSDQEMVTKFLRKVFFPILFSIASILIFGPTTLAIVATVIGTIFAVKGGVEVLFSNNRPGTLYDPSSQDKGDTEKGAGLDAKIRNGIDSILKTKVKEIPEQISQGSKKQPTPEQASQVGNEGSEQLTVLDGQVTVDQLVEEQGQQSSKTQTYQK